MAIKELLPADELRWDLAVRKLRSHFVDTRTASPSSDALQTKETLAFYLFIFHRSLTLDSTGKCDWDDFGPKDVVALTSDLDLLGSAHFYLRNSPQARRDFADRFLGRLLVALDGKVFGDWRKFIGETRRRGRELVSLLGEAERERPNERELTKLTELREQLRFNEGQIRAFFWLLNDERTTPWKSMTDSLKERLLGSGSYVSLNDWISNVTAAVQEALATQNSSWQQHNKEAISWPLSGEWWSLMGLPEHVSWALREDELAEWDAAVGVFRKHFVKGREEDAESKTLKQKTIDALSLYLFTLRRTLRVLPSGRSDWDKVPESARQSLWTQMQTFKSHIIYLPAMDDELRLKVDKLGETLILALDPNEEVVHRWAKFVKDNRALERALEQPTNAHLRPDLGEELQSDEAWVRALVFLKGRAGEPLLDHLNPNEKFNLLDKCAHPEIEVKIEWLTDAISELRNEKKSLPLEKLAKEATDWPLELEGLHSLGRLSPVRRTTRLRSAVLRKAN